MTKKTCFISYAREDAVFAQRLYDSLSSRGVQVWFDREALRPGERWEPAIRNGIRGSRYFLALLSSRAVSKKGFVQREIREALEVLSEYPDNEIYLIPLRLDDCDPTHDRLRELQWLDLFPNWDFGVTRLVRFLGIATVATQAPVPTTQPAPGVVAAYVQLRFDGLYQSERQHDYWQYFRFHDDGLVLAVSSSGSPAQVAAWLTRDNKSKHSHGTYSLSGRRLSFSSTSEEGTVDYEGSLEGDTIIVSHHSHINGNRGVAQYDFRPLTA